MPANSSWNSAFKGLTYSTKIINNIPGKTYIHLSQKQHLTRRRLFTSKLYFNLGKKLVKCHNWSIALYGAETWMLWKVEKKYVESYDMWCWRKMEKISWTDHVINEEVLHIVKEEYPTYSK